MKWLTNKIKSVAYVTVALTGILYDSIKKLIQKWTQLF